MPYITAQDGTRLFVKEWGRGRPVVLIHGWPLQADSFDDLAVAIANAGMRAISYDRRGFGRSDQPWDGYNYDTLADDLADVLQQTHAEGAALVGFSMGGGEIARYMSRHAGNKVTQAVLIASVVPYMLKTADNPDGTDAAVFDGMAQGIQKDRAAFFRDFAKSFYGVGLVKHPVSSEVLDWTFQMAMQAGLWPTLACAKAFATTDFRADLAAFRVPTLVIHGTGDATVPIDAAGRKAAAGIAGAELIEYDGGPHGLLASHKDRIAADVLRFLDIH